MRAKFYLELSPFGLEDGLEREKLDTILNHAFEIVHFSTEKLDIIVLESIYYLLTEEKLIKHGSLICNTIKSLDYLLSQVRVDPTFAFECKGAGLGAVSAGKELFNTFSECYQLKIVTADIHIVKKINLYFHNSMKGIKSLEYRI